MRLDYTRGIALGSVAAAYFVEISVCSIDIPASFKIADQRLSVAPSSSGYRATLTPSSTACDGTTSGEKEGVFSSPRQISDAEAAPRGGFPHPLQARANPAQSWIRMHLRMASYIPDFA